MAHRITRRLKGIREERAMGRTELIFTIALGFILYAFPLKVQGGHGAAARIVAWLA